jgi:hypothetical protein
MQRKDNAQTEIFRLMTSAVSNAVARRNQAFEEDLTTLSNDETAAIMGGLGSNNTVIVKAIVKPPITAGIISIPEEVA